MSVPRRIGLRRLRAARGFSQEGFAQAVGLNRAYYGGIEKGQRNVDAANLARIAEALGMSLSEFFAEVEKARKTGRRLVVEALFGPAPFGLWARELGREGSPFGPIPKTVDKNDHTPTKTPCLCGCGELVERTFKAGHDMRLVSLAKAYVRGEAEPTAEQMTYLENSGKLKQARTRVAKEERKRNAKK